jgi:hypothetical protein
MRGTGHFKQATAGAGTSVLAVLIGVPGVVSVACSGEATNGIGAVAVGGVTVLAVGGVTLLAVGTEAVLAVKSGIVFFLLAFFAGWAVVLCD